MTSSFFFPVLNWLLRHTDLCNAVAAGVILAWGVGLAFVYRATLKKNRWMLHALGFWLFQWLVFPFTYLYFHLNPGPPGIWLLPLVDLQSAFAVGFFLAYLYGESYRPLVTWITLGVIVGVLAAWGLWLGSEAVTTAVGSQWRYAWVSLSEVVSATALVMMGGVFVLRYGLFALLPLIANIFYAALQRPIYSGVFVSLNPQPKWFLAVAVGKIIIGSLFYLFFFTPLEKYPVLALPSPDQEVRDIIKKRLAVGISFILRLFKKNSE